MCGWLALLPVSGTQSCLRVGRKSVEPRRTVAYRIGFRIFRYPPIFPLRFGRPEALPLGGFTKNRKNVAPAPKAPETPVAETPVAETPAAPVAVTVAPYSKATPARKDGKTGPDPKALAEGRINPLREGKVFAALRAGEGSTVAELVAATGLRDVTVRYFGISGGEAGILDAIRIGSEYRFVVAADDAKASEKAKAVRLAVIALRDAATAPKAPEAVAPEK